MILKRLKFTAGFLAIFPALALADMREFTLINEDFANLSDWQDLSTIPAWGPEQSFVNQSMFKVEDGAVSLVRSGEYDTTPWKRYWLLEGNKAFTALDQQFPFHIRHATSTVTIDLRLRYENIGSKGKPGEHGRLLVILNYDYPDGGLNMTPEGTDGNWVRNREMGNAWARPAYHLRVRNGGDGNASALLQYGGGVVKEGEFEYFTNTDAGYEWWLAGFISGALVEGVDQSNIPGVGGPEYPFRSWKHTTLDWQYDDHDPSVVSPPPSARISLAHDEWYHIRYVVSPDKQEVFVDFSGNGDNFIKYGEMPLPQTLSEHPLYNYFETFEGLRIYWSAGDDPATDYDDGQIYIDEVAIHVSTTDQPPAIITTELPAAQAGVAYQAALEAEEGVGELTWMLAEGSELPAGLVLSEDGNISGTPESEVVDASFEVMVMDTLRAQAMKSLSLTVEAGGSIWEDERVTQNSDDSLMVGTFGPFWAFESWIWHPDFGWMYFIGEDVSNIFMWQPTLGWLWLNLEDYPFIYSYDRGSFLYHLGAGSFYIYADGETVELL